MTHVEVDGIVLYGVASVVSTYLPIFCNIGSWAMLLVMSIPALLCSSPRESEV